MIFRTLYISLLALLLFSCGKDSSEAMSNGSTPNTQKAKKSDKELAKGPLSKIYIIADDSTWDTAMTDTVIYYFQSAYPILPSPEPLYDLMRYSTQQIKNKAERRELRTYMLIADLNDKESLATKMALKDIGPEKAKEIEKSGTYKLIVGKDKWAEQQIIVYLMGYGKEQLYENIRANFNAVDKAIRKGEYSKRNNSIFLGGTNSKVKSEIKETMAINIEVPSDFKLAMNNKEDNVIWLRKETSKASLNLMIKNMGSFNEADFSKKGMKDIRNELGLFVSSNKENSYMIINDIDLPMLMSSTSFNGNFALEARGIWELENDFMGGPFISYIVHNPNSDQVYFIDGFVHAPGEEKREHMLQLEHIIKSLAF
jgi:hypothetical protein